MVRRFGRPTWHLFAVLLTAVAIAPDFGERYLDTVYHTNWVQDLYGEDVLSSDELITASGPA